MNNQADPYGRGSYCIVAALHGSDSTEAETLRRFRDTVLRNMPLGNTVIDLYYRASPTAARTITRLNIERPVRTFISAVSTGLRPLF